MSGESGFYEIPCRHHPLGWCPGRLDRALLILSWAIIDSALVYFLAQFLVSVQP